MVRHPSPRNLDPSASGLAPLAAGPAASIDHLAVDALEHLPHDVMALVIGPMMDRIAAGARAGESDYVIRRLRTFVQVAIRGLYECELRRAGLLQRVDFDPTTR
jgi:hypothetical protein